MLLVHSVNNDKFAVNRELPQTEIGDLLVIHDTGVMVFLWDSQYNAKLVTKGRSSYAEDLYTRLIHRAERSEGLFCNPYI